MIFESQTFAVAALKASVTAPASETQKHLAAPDRVARVAQLKARYPGLDITGPEPSHMLYDQCLTIFDSEEVRYIPPSKCLSRQQELANQKPEKEAQLDAAKGSLVVKEVNHQKEVQPCSDRALYQAMSRRALAFDLIGLATYTTVHEWHCGMFALMEQPPAPGFARVTQAHVLRADRQAFIRLGEQVNGALKPRADGTKPLDDVINTLANDVSVSYFLLPTPAGKEVEKSSAETSKKPNKESSSSASKKTIKQSPQKKRRTEIPCRKDCMEWQAEPKTTNQFVFHTTWAVAPMKSVQGNTCAASVDVGNRILKPNIVDYLQEEVKVSPSRSVPQRDLFQLPLQSLTMFISVMVIHFL